MPANGIIDGISGPHPSNEAVVLTAIPDAGYSFVTWTGDVPIDSLYINPLTIIMNQNRVVSCTFLSDPVKLRVTSPYGTPTPPTYDNFYEVGTSVTCQVSGSPVSGAAGIRYVLTGWVGTGDVPATGVTNSTGAFTITQESTITWTWKTQYYLNVSEIGSGSVTGAAGWYDSGTVVSLTATAGAGQQFSYWSEDVPSGSEITNPLSITMDQPRNIVANFSAFSVPSGGIIMYHGSVTLSEFDATGLGVGVNTGWALCNGNNGTPNLKGQFIAGYDPSTVDYNTIGNTGGSATHALSIAEMAAHNHGGGGTTGAGGAHTPTGSATSNGNHSHSGSTNSTGSHSHGYRQPYGSTTRDGSTPLSIADITDANTSSAGDHSHSVSINSAGSHGHTVTINPVTDHTHSVTVTSQGSGTAHENRPQFYVLAFIKKI